MKAILFSLFLLFSIMSSGQKSIPSSFIGHWQGEMAWYRPGGGEPKKFRMQLIIAPTDSAGQYTWKTIYGDNGEDTRNYVLNPVDTTPGRWVVDERNGILIDQYLVGGRFYSVFTVQGITIMNSYWREGDKLAVEFASWPTRAVRTSGEGTEESPTVESFGVRSYQKGILSRVKPPQKLPLRKPKK